MSGLQHVSCLLVDDNAHMLNIVKSVLRGFGAVDLYDTHDPIDALAVLASRRFDLVIVDYQMPVLDGIDLVNIIRRNAHVLSPRAAVILLTAHTERTRVLAARDAGVNEICAKPVTAAELARKINAVILSERVFVESESYVGPDRRRSERPIDFPDRRRRSAP